MLSGKGKQPKMHEVQVIRRRRQEEAREGSVVEEKK
jgi:hypothetical protein